MLAPRFVIFTRLENCLLDPRTDSASAAEEAIAELERRRIPWVIFSARTRAQLEPLRRKIAHRHPFVSENGGGLFLPQGYFNIAVEGSRRAGGYQLISIGTPYLETCAALDEVAEESGVEIARLQQMNLRETEENLKLEAREAKQARQREFEELFFIVRGSENEIARVLESARERGFSARPDEPMWHFSSAPDTGRAARQLVQLFRTAMRDRFQIVGIGSSSFDFSMLSAASKHYMMDAGDRSSIGEASERGMHIQNAGPAGPTNWAKLVLRVLEL